MMTNDILEFKGKYRFLSNFWPVVVVYDGQYYPSVEHAYQAAKTLDLSEREEIAKCKTAGAAKRLGRKISLRSDWMIIRKVIMKELLDKKFEHPELKTLLLMTYPRKLVEGNTWRDTFWGVYRGEGENNLGEMLVFIRSQLKP